MMEEPLDAMMEGDADGNGKGKGRKKEVTELRRYYERKLKDMRTSYDAGLEKLRREHQTEIGRLRETREAKYADYERRLQESARDITNLRGLLALQQQDAAKPAAVGDEAAGDAGTQTTIDTVTVTENLPAKVMELKQKVQDLTEELDFSNQLFHDLSVYCDSVKSQVNQAKDVLISVGSVAFPEVLPTLTFCEASPEEVERVLLACKEKGGLENALDELEEMDVCEDLAAQAGEVPGRVTTNTNPVYGNNPNKNYLVPIKVLDKALEEVDAAVRDQRFDPFKRKDGDIVDVDWTDERLKGLEATYGRPLAELVVKKKREVEKYCPSGGYPTPVLYDKGQELTVGEAILRLIQELKKKCGIHIRPKPVHHSGPNAYLDITPAMRDALPYLTRHTTGTSTVTPGVYHPYALQDSGLPLPDSLGHIFVRWLKVQKEIKEEPAWGYFRVANKALSKVMRPHERECKSEEEVRRWLDSRRDAIDCLCDEVDRPTRVAVRALLLFIQSRQQQFGLKKPAPKPAASVPHSKNAAHYVPSSASSTSSSSQARRRRPSQQQQPSDDSAEEDSDLGESDEEEEDDNAHLQSVHAEVLSGLADFMASGRRLTDSRTKRSVRMAAPMVEMIMGTGDTGVKTFSERVIEQLSDLEAIRDSTDTPTEKRVLKEVVRFGLAVHTALSQGEDPGSRWGPSKVSATDSRAGGLGKEVREAFQSWMKTNKSLDNHVSKALVREACKLLRYVSLACHPTKTPKAIKAADDVRELLCQNVSEVEIIMRDAGRPVKSAGELLWEFLTGEERVWAGYQGPEGVDLSGWDTSDEEDQEDEDEEDDGEMEVDELWMLSSALSHEVRQFMRKRRGKDKRKGDLLVSGAATLLGEIMGNQAQQLNTKQELRAVLEETPSDVAEGVTKPGAGTRKQAARALLKFANVKWGNLAAAFGAKGRASGGAAPSKRPSGAIPPIPPLPDALAERFEAYLSKAEGLTNPWPYVEALASLYHKFMTRKLEEGRCEETKAILNASKTSAGITEKELWGLFRVCKDMVRMANVTQHREKEAVRYFNDMMTDVQVKKRRADEAAEAADEAAKRLRREGEWRSLSQTVMNEFGRWLEVFKDRKMSTLDEAALLFVDDMFKTLVMKNNTLFTRGDIKWLVKGYPAHLNRIAAPAPATHQEAWELFRDFVLSEDRLE